ncbi:diguanylate cyclase, partial [Acinetobacter baumannii]|uniref:diguanylate cyclase domain-containing protein n=1 Tax=Acinetobacter baumannii TaxID=470 RepID=UPI003A8968CA
FWCRLIHLKIILWNKPLEIGLCNKALPHTDIIQAEKIAERCRQALQELTIFNNQNIQIHVSASFGISSSTFANDPYLVIRQADQALYAVKASGRNQVRTFHQLPQIKSI